MRESIKRGKIIEDRIKGIVLKWIIRYSLNTMVLYHLRKSNRTTSKITFF